MASDTRALCYHFTAPEGDCRPFDPNGAIFWRGRYHLFYIFQDPSLPHGGHCWGHASSPDLLDWTIHPPALKPAEGDPEVGIFSGGAFLDKAGRPVLIYHGVGAGTCLAVPADDDLLHWRKSPHNPVIPEPREGDPGWGVYNVFDPHAWLEGDRYYAILGGKVKPDDRWDTVYLFTSADLVHWEYQRPFYRPDPRWTGEEEDCACPDFFPLGDRHVLLCISHPRGARCYLGRYRNGTFFPEEHHRMNWPGGACFAPESLLDDRGRRIFWTWALDQQSRERPLRGLGVMTLPRVLSLERDGSLKIEPAAELESLRSGRGQWRDLELAPGRELSFDELRGDSLELGLEAGLAESGALALKVCCSPGGEEQTVILCDRREGSLLIDTTRSSLDPRVWRPFPIMRRDAESQDVPVQTAPFELRPGERLKLRVFLDRTILEVFANGRQCLTQRIYPTRGDSLGVSLVAARGGVKVHALTAWEMNGIRTVNS